MFGERLHAIALAGVVTGSEVRDTGLARQMHGLLRDLAAQVEVGAKRDGLFEQALRAAGTPGDTAYQARAIANRQRHSL
ncbi:MAG: hypothetical protein AW09_002818 [Candidatus Accumulibacter phosphatis]|uniref:Uncharacterized protein n=1 Tax=Candidatus Accumulibacter phosphatis TaxID=327160 RepID=A0A080LTZ7_9PROT|nr:MAG: hypothetical protein AW09_002818 [Candidatus Accumulibacter phosphatis]